MAAAEVEVAAIRKTMMTAAVVADRVTAAKLAQAAAAAETPLVGLLGRPLLLLLPHLLESNHLNQGIPPVVLLAFILPMLEVFLPIKKPRPLCYPQLLRFLSKLSPLSKSLPLSKPPPLLSKPSLLSKPPLQ